MSTATGPHSIGGLRASRWLRVPARPGVYWWYFPQSWVQRFEIAKHSPIGRLTFRQGPKGTVCLYHGMATCLRQRLIWHAEQKLAPSALQSGYLSTFRFSLLALNAVDFATGGMEIDRLMNELAISWQVTPTAGHAKTVEHTELGGRFHYPLNLQGNSRAELTGFRQHLKSLRKSYKLRHLK